MLRWYVFNLCVTYDIFIKTNTKLSFQTRELWCYYQICQKLLYELQLFYFSLCKNEIVLLMSVWSFELCDFFIANNFLFITNATHFKQNSYTQALDQHFTCKIAFWLIFFCLISQHLPFYQLSIGSPHSPILLQLFKQHSLQVFWETIKTAKFLQVALATSVDFT